MIICYHKLAIICKFVSTLQKINFFLSMSQKNILIVAVIPYNDPCAHTSTILYYKLLYMRYWRFITNPLFAHCYTNLFVFSTFRQLYYNIYTPQVFETDEYYSEEYYEKLSKLLANFYFHKTIGLKNEAINGWHLW